MVLCRDVPCRRRAVAAAADPEPAALADGEERKPPMLTDASPVPGLDGPRRSVHEASEKRRETALADEAEAGAAGLVVRRQSRLPGHAAHRVLAQPTEREYGAIESRLVERVQEVALILAGVRTLEQPHPVGGALDPGVVAGCDALGAEPARMLDERGELHLPIAHHVRIRGHSSLEIPNEAREDLVPVRIGAVHRMQGHAEPVADPLRVGQILGRRTVAVAVVLLPALHEHRLHRDARLHQAHQRHRGIDAAGYRDHRRRVFVRARAGAIATHAPVSSECLPARPPARPTRR